MQRIMREVAEDPTANEIEEIWYRKSIPLSPNYHITYAEHPQKKGQRYDQIGVRSRWQVKTILREGLSRSIEVP